MNYFNYFEIPIKFNIKKKDLSKKYYSLQKKYHPDFYINYSKKKQKKILKKSIHINKGYEILKNPIKRIKYILKLKGYDLKHINNKNRLNQSFLKKQYKYFKKLEKININNKKIKKDNKFYKKIKNTHKKYFNKIKEKIIKKCWKKAFLIFQKIIFLKKIIKKLEKKM
ncbi:MAG: Fe-S protein assembly co-chaperone HscB [Buchnera aphidicola (Periphyllus acericola)]|uniref:Fe-S protein assembly co-chaperone HscB n=1 Tax=Buchnera aphidicola TaxID=9 RepID=UPI0030CD17DF|nr:Fe-S protein assembly co-chaperone HscB [Buchnera aphidicola (Periphyllus acericola)]